jgi:membrane associated rhomboid family serine protease
MTPSANKQQGRPGDSVVLILNAESDSNRTIWVTWVLVALNIVGFALQAGLGDRISYGYCLVPAEIVTDRDIVTPQDVKIPVAHIVETKSGKGKIHTRVEVRQEWITIPHQPGPRPIQLTLFTWMFLHGSLLHLGGNMLFLIVFGRHVEACLRPGLYLAAYLFCGVTAGVVHALHDPDSVMPCVGASGAISGLLGAYLFLNPFGRVTVWVVLWIFRIPAFVVLTLWVLEQCVAVALGAEGLGTQVAYWAHLGGFVAGPAFILCIMACLKSQQEPTRQAAKQPEQTLENFLPLRDTQPNPVEEDFRWR